MAPEPEFDTRAIASNLQSQLDFFNTEMNKPAMSSHSGQITGAEENLEHMSQHGVCAVLFFSPRPIMKSLLA